MQGRIYFFIILLGNMWAKVWRPLVSIIICWWIFNNLQSKPLSRIPIIFPSVSWTHHLDFPSHLKLNRSKHELIVFICQLKYHQLQVTEYKCQTKWGLFFLHNKKPGDRCLLVLVQQFNDILAGRSAILLAFPHSHKMFYSSRHHAWVQDRKKGKEAKPVTIEPFFFFFNKFIYLFFYLFWLCWVFVAAHGLSLVAASRGHPSLQCTGFSLQWLLLLCSMGSRCTDFSGCGAWAQ